MKILSIRGRIVAGALSLLLLIAAPWARAQNPDLSMTIDAGATGAPINRYVYGQFTELLRNMYEKGIWSEMLSDRKFFYPVDSSPTLDPPNSKPFFNRWRPVGGDDAVAMDTVKPFVGKHSPMINLSGDTPRGMTQVGLVVRAGRQYTGRIALRGSAGAKVEVTLAWGDGAGDRQTIATPALTNAYAMIPLKFTAGGDSDRASFTIAGTGQGEFHVGVVSLMPADNVHGFRADLVALLKDLDQGTYRWPGGNFASGYDWRDGIGDADLRPPRYDYAWNTVEYNDVGTDDFLTLCGLLGIDPYICVNAGLGDARSAAEWVEYCNGSADTAMGKLRAANGHPEPYHIRMWNIGNEEYGEWQLGHLYVDQYAIKHNQFAEAMRAVDPSIQLIASGATIFETSTTARHHRKPLPATLPYQYGSKQDWSFVLLQKCADNIDMLAEHVYPVNNSRFDVPTQVFVRTDDPMVDQVRRTPNRIKGAVEALEEYHRLLPNLKDKHITLAIDEWTGGNRMDFSSTLCAAEGLQEMFRHTDVITMGAYTGFMANVNYNGAESCYSATGLMFQMYRKHFGTIPVAVSGNSPQHEVSGTVGVDKPVESSGSPTYPLDVAAALTADYKHLTIAVVNPTDARQTIHIALKSVELEDSGMKWEIVPATLQTRNVAGQEPKVKTVETTLAHRPDALDVPPYSVSVYEFGCKAP
jgi:alpha-N-arabinofuranosidase